MCHFHLLILTAQSGLQSVDGGDGNEREERVIGSKGEIKRCTVGRSISHPRETSNISKEGVRREENSRSVLTKEKNFIPPLHTHT